MLLLSGFSSVKNILFHRLKFKREAIKNVDYLFIKV